MLKSAEFKAAIINMPKELKKTMFKELNEGTITISLQIEGSNEETNYTKQSNANSEVEMYNI